MPGGCPIGFMYLIYRTLIFAWILLVLTLGAVISAESVLEPLLPFGVSCVYAGPS